MATSIKDITDAIIMGIENDTQLRDWARGITGDSSFTFHSSTDPVNLAKTIAIGEERIIDIEGIASPLHISVTLPDVTPTGDGLRGCRRDELEYTIYVFVSGDSDDWDQIDIVQDFLDYTIAALDDITGLGDGAWITNASIIRTLADLNIIAGIIQLIVRRSTSL